MPYIEAKFTSALTEEAIEALKSGLGKAIELIPGKTEEWLMINFFDQQNIFFMGNQDADTAFISVAISGTAPAEAYAAFTAELTALVARVTNISPKRTYITYREVAEWGWNGSI